MEMKVDDKWLKKKIETEPDCCIVAGAEDRKETLLKAALEFLHRHQDYISGTVDYDEADCDVDCLIDDIKAELDV